MTSRRPAATAGRQRVFRPVCALGAPGRSVGNCIGPPTSGAPLPPHRSPGSDAAPRTPLDRSGGYARLCRFAAGAAAECSDGGSPQLRRRGRTRRRILSVIALEAPDGERKGPLQLGEEREARAVVQPPIEPQHAEAGAIVQGGVLERPAARDRHVFHIDLDRLTWFRFLEQLHLAGLPLAGAP